MRRITLDEQKDIELSILKYVHQICSENEIEYSLCGGTLLGAIRHKGFIPWDDDIDIFLVRAEYDRLIQVLKKDKNYLLISSEDTGYFHAFAKLVDKRTVMTMDNPNEPKIPNLGVHIDIFPIDGLPNNRKDQEIFAKSIRQLMYNMRTSMTHSYYDSQSKWKKKVKKIACFPKHLLVKEIANPETWKLILLNSMKMYDFESSEYAGFVLSGYGIKEVLPKDKFLGCVEVEFENEKFCAFEGYESYLKAIYGDYMQLPPKEKRISLHYYTAYWKD